MFLQAPESLLSRSFGSTDQNLVFLGVGHRPTDSLEEEKEYHKSWGVGAFFNKHKVMHQQNDPEVIIAGDAMVRFHPDKHSQTAAKQPCIRLLSCQKPRILAYLCLGAGQGQTCSVPAEARNVHLTHTEFCESLSLFLPQSVLRAPLLFRDFHGRWLGKQPLAAIGNHWPHIEEYSDTQKRKLLQRVRVPMSQMGKPKC